MATGQTGFWEIAQLALSVAQMVFYIKALDEYKTKLEDMGAKMEGYADSDRANYALYRGADPSFYNYYLGLPDYHVCESNVQRARGRVVNKYGESVRKFKKTLRRGFTPLSTITYNSYVGHTIPQSMSAERAIIYTQEQNRADEHVANRWSAIASAPAGNEGNLAAGYQGVIQSFQNSMNRAGIGFNSAGAAFGTSLYKILN